MNLTLLLKTAKNSALSEGCYHNHLTVSSQDNMMGQQVTLPLLTPVQCHGTESRQDEWSNEGFEYPSGQKQLFQLFHLKAEYMTEATDHQKFILLSSPGPYMTRR